MSNTYGVPNLAIPSLYLQAVIELIVKAGILLQSQSVVKPKTLENTITKRLNKAMDVIRAASESDIIWWDLTWDYRVNTASDPIDPLKEGEIDIKFRWNAFPANNARYLAVEAKKLFGIGSSRADDYVTKGVMDFVTGKYARMHSYGVMLGYIVTGPVPHAVEAVNDAMAKRHTLTAEHSAFCPNNSMCAHPHTHHSTHIQQPTHLPITLIHVFLDLT